MSATPWTKETLGEAVTFHAQMAAWILVHTGNVSRAMRHARAYDRLALVLERLTITNRWWEIPV